MSDERFHLVKCLRVQESRPAGSSWKTDLDHGTVSSVMNNYQ